MKVKIAILMLALIPAGAMAAGGGTVLRGGSTGIGNGGGSILVEIKKSLDSAAAETPVPAARAVLLSLKALKAVEGIGVEWVEEVLVREVPYEENRKREVILVLDESAYFYHVDNHSGETALISKREY